jgi:hypothetical protein
MNSQIDIRHVLPAIRVPALIMHRTGDRSLSVEGSRYMARQIPGGRYVEYEGDDHLPWAGNTEAVLDDVEEFLTGARHVVEADRMLATVMFVDIVRSTERAAEIGDRKWREVLEGFYSMVRRNVERFRGREIDTAGDGFFGTFDGPARAVRCAQGIGNDVPVLGIAIRAGVIPAKSRLLAVRSVGSPYTLERGWRAKRGPAR